MLIDMWRTTKRSNSTATPVSQPGWFTNHIQKEVKLKDPVSVLNPTFILNMGGHDGQNFVWAFGRYYWVTGITSLAKDLWEISCKVDPLGSYRGHIRNTQAYVLYDSTANSEIPDNRLGVQTTPTTSQNTAEMPWGFSTGKGTKFLAVEGDGDLITQGKADGATGVYIVTDADIEAIGMDFTIQEILDSMAQYQSVDLPAVSVWDNLLGVRNIDDILQKIKDNLSITGAPLAALYCYILAWVYPIMAVIGLIDTIKGLILGGDALKHVKASYLLPFDCSDEGSSRSRVAFGSFVDTLPSAKLLSNPYKNAIVNVAIPWQYSDWRNVQNTEIQLFIPLIGNINIPTSAVKGKSNISVKMNLNMFSGALSVRVQCGDVTLGSFGSNVQMPILIGDSNVNAPNIMNTVVAGAAMAAGVATGAGALTAGALGSAIQNGLNCIQPISTAVGGIGGGCGNNLGFLIVCTTICHNTSDAPSNLLPIIGTPTNKLKTLSGTGFCQCMQAHMNMTAVTGESYPTATEVEEVDNALNNGVFLE